MASRKDQLATLISGVPVFIHCSASITSGIVKESCFALVMFTVLISPIESIGDESSRDRRAKRIGNTFEAMLHSQSLRFMIIWRKTAICMPIGFPQMRYFMKRFDTC